MSLLARTARLCLAVNPTRMIALTPSNSAEDPVQKLFVEKVREYAKKQKAAGGKMVDATADTEKQLNNQLNSVANQFGIKKPEDAFEFPQINFEEPKYEESSITAKA